MSKQYEYHYEEPTWRSLTAADVHRHVTDEFVEQTAIDWRIPVYRRNDWGKWLASLIDEAVTKHVPIPASDVQVNEGKNTALTEGKEEVESE